MRIASLIIFLALSSLAAAQTVWKYVDDKGVTHYTDQPVPGAEKVQLSSGNTAVVPAPLNKTATTTPAAQLSYRTFRIVRPADQDSVVNTGGLLQVSMQLEPAVMEGHTVSLYMDGKLLEGYPRNALEYEIQNVPRGDHTLQGVIIDSSERRITQTSKVTFTMRQKSILMKPPVGPSVRPSTKAPSTPRAPARAAQPSFADLHPAPTKSVSTPAPSL